MSVITMTGDDGLPPAEPAVGAPETFRRAVASHNATTVRREVRVESLRPPQRLAPYS
jgi:hypothetical protein